MATRTTSLGGSGSTADQLAVRRHNLAVVMTHLRTNGPRSRARVAAETGLNKGTVSSLVAELVARGLVTEGETERGGMGRPGQVIDLDRVNYVAIGAEINIDYISVLAMNLRGETVAEKRIPLDTAHMAPDDVIRHLARTAKTVISQMERRGSSAIGMTVAVPGIVDSSSGVVFDAVNLGWPQIPVGEVVRQRLGDPPFPIYIDNEANASAIAELVERGAEQPEDLLLLTGGVGVGGGIVARGELVRGARGFAGELGHMQVNLNGRRCGCGRIGCWETEVGLGALLRLATTSGDLVRDPTVDLVDRLEELRRRAESGNKKTLRAIEAVGGWLVEGATSLVNIFNPQVLVLGGYFAVLGPWVTTALEEGLAAQVHAPEAGGCRVELSTLGFSAAVRGGAHHAIRSVFDDPTAVPLLETIAASAKGATS
jgi:predicted NBD/HSP70 family sugar kinase